MFCCYMGSGDYWNSYLYMSLAYSSEFTPRIYSYFKLMINTTAAIGTLIVMPLMANVLQLHETTMGFIIQFLNATGKQLS